MMFAKLKPVLDFLFPQTNTERTIETLSPEILGSHLVPFEKEGVCAFFSYDDELAKQMIWLLKYRGNVRVAELLAESVCDVLTEELADRALFHDFNDLLLVPIPLSKKRLRKRGYNQALIFAKALGRQNTALNTIAQDMLVKVRETPPQTELTKEARQTNVMRVFAVPDPSAVLGRNILLIDDVTTTGSTFREARKVLEEAGARSVVCLAIAH